MPKLSVDTIRSRPAPARTSFRRETEALNMSPFGAVDENRYNGVTEQPKLFSMMPSLTHQGLTGAANSQPMQPNSSTLQGAPGSMQSPMPRDLTDAPQQYVVPASMVANTQSQGHIQPSMPAPGQQVEMIDQAHLINILTNIQKLLEEQNTDQRFPTSTEDVNKIDISSSVGEMLQETQKEGVIAAVDGQSPTSLILPRSHTTQFGKMSQCPYRSKNLSVELKLRSSKLRLLLPPFLTRKIILPG